MSWAPCCLWDKCFIAPTSVRSGGDGSPHGGAKVICLRSLLSISLRHINARKKLGAAGSIKVSGALRFLNVNAFTTLFGFSRRGQAGLGTNTAGQARRPWPAEAFEKQPH